MKNKLTLFIILFLLPVLLTAQSSVLPPPNKDEFIYFTADEVTYDTQNEVAALKGNVEVYIDDKGDKKVIKGTDIQIFTKNQILISKGLTTIEDEKGLFSAEDMHFDLASRRIILQEVRADFYPIRVLRNESIEARENTYIIRRATLTCCDREKPHYTVYVGRANLKPGDRIYATNAVLKIGKVPVFYLPFIYRSLNTDRLFTTYVEFEQSGNTGFGFLTSTVLNLGKFQAAANLDFYTKSGFGYGIETSYHDPSRFRGSLQAYSIYDRNKSEQRWGINGGYWWEVHDSSDSLNNKDGAIYFSQFETRNVSDPEFNDDFFRANPYVVTPDKITRVSVVRQSRVNTLRIAYTNRRQLNEDNDGYSNYEESLPKLDLIFNPFTIKTLGGIVNDVAFSLNNTRLEDYDFVQYMEGRWRASRDFKLHRNFTLTPSGWYNQQIILKDPTNNDEDKFVSRYGGQLNFRSDLITGLLDIGYRYEKRNTSGSLTTTADDFDRGEESNLVFIQNYYMPLPGLYFRAGTGYDLRNSEESWEAKNRIEPILAEVGLFSPVTGTNLFLQNLYDIEDGNQAFVLNTTFKRSDGSSVNFGATNYRTDRDTFLFTTKFLLSPKNWTWRADMGLDFSVSDSSISAYSKHIRIGKDFHDVSLEAGIRDRNNNLSFLVRINVFCGRKEAPPVRREINEHWYPWRRDNAVRDNF